MHITYEELLAWFEAADGLGGRRAYKLALLWLAIERARLGWQLVPHPNVGLLWHSYWRLAAGIAPQLVMPVPKAEIPADSHFVRFRPASLPPNIRLLHKVGYGHVDLQFADMGAKLGELEQLYRRSLLPSMRIEKAAKSAVIRVLVDPVDMTKTEAAAAEPRFRAGIEAAAALLSWYVGLEARA